MWAKFDDEYFENRKVRSVSALAQHLHMASIVHCAKGETDGFFPKYDLALVSAQARIDSPNVTMRELLTARLMHDRGESYEVHDYLDYNPSHAELEAKRESGAKRVKNWRGNGKRNKGGNSGCNGDGNSVTPTVGNGGCAERPDPRYSLSGSSSLSASDPDPERARVERLPPSRPGGHDLVAMFGKVRLEVFPNTLPWNTARDTKGDAGSFAALLSDEDIADLEPTMRLALGKIKAGAVGWTNPELSVSPSFAFGKWKSDFTGLREELHGRAPVVRTGPVKAPARPWKAAAPIPVATTPPAPWPTKAEEEAAELQRKLEASTSAKYAGART